MIIHITVEDAAKLISRIAGTNEMQALTYIREAADRGEIQAATALSTLQAELQKSEHDNVNLTGELAKVAAELEQVKRERDAAVERIREWEKFDTYLFVHSFITPEKWRGEKEG